MDKDFMKFLVGMLGAYSDGNLGTEYSTDEVSQVVYVSAHNTIVLDYEGSTVILSCKVAS